MRKASEKDEELDSSPVGHTHETEETLTPEQSRVQDLGRLAGNAAVAGAMMSAPESTVRSQVEGVTGFDLSPTTIHRDSTRAASAGVHGLTEGHEVHLAPGISPGTPHGDHVLAHELGHVVQQSTATPGTHDSLEAGAESIAHSRTTSSGTLAALPAPKQLAVQHFDPRYHRTSVVDGLAGSDFTPEETGMIYAANWERDLSQVHPVAGNVILRWKAAKVATAEGRLTQAEIDAFQQACEAVLMMAKTPGALINGTSYGGYKFYEHMDNPVDTPDAAQVANALGGLNTSGLPDHIFISREYIKEMLYDAASLNFPDLAGQSTATAAQNSQKVRDKLGTDPAAVGGGLSTAPVAQETAAEVRAKQSGGSGSGAAVPAQALELIGRASHALEDFWSHSNFVELAIGDVEFQLKGLTTASFGTADKAHALSHKLRALGDEIAAEVPLADRLANRRQSAPGPDEVHVGNETPPVHDSFFGNLGQAITDLPKELLTLPISAAAGAARGWNGSAGEGIGDRLQKAGRGAITGQAVSLLGSSQGVHILRTASEVLDEGSQIYQEKIDKNREAHGLLAKDQPGHDDDAAAELKTMKFDLAHALSVASDRRVTAKMKAVLNAGGIDEANRLLAEIHADLDQLIAGPSDHHPLNDIVIAYRERAALALKKAGKKQSADAGR